MMKNKIYRYVLIACGALSMTACNNWLDVTPENSIADSDLFEEGYGFRNALNGIYINLAEPDLYGCELSWGFLSAVGQQYMQGDDVESPLYRDAALRLYNTDQTESVVKNIWEKGYLVIANVNKLLAELKEADPSIFAYGEEEKDMIYGEALALRAMMHFDLLRLFAPSPASNPTGTYLPYRVEFDANVAPKLTVRAFLEKVYADFEEAGKLLKKVDLEWHPEAMYASGKTEPSAYYAAFFRLAPSAIDEMGIFFWYRGFRMNYMSVLGLMARAYMYGGETYYLNARSCAKELYDQFYKNRIWIGFTEASNITCGISLRHLKVIDDMLFGLYKQTLTEDYQEKVWRTSLSSNTTRLPLANIETLFAADNVGQYSDYRLDYLIGQTNEANSRYYTLKYNESTDDQMMKMENPTIPVMRFSEVCHILAELCAKEGNISEGIEYLETVRRARGAERSLSLTVQDADDLMEEIIMDARKEFLGEGQTFFLYKRLNMSMIDSGNDGGTQIDMSGSYVLPVPTSESIN